MVPVGASRSRPAVGGRSTVSKLVKNILMITVLLVVGMLGTLLVGCSMGISAPKLAELPAAPPPPPPPVASITTDPPDRATDVSPLAPITVTVAKGKLGQVTLTNPQGAPVVGQLEPDGTSWKTNEPLGYGQAYMSKSEAVGDDNRPVTIASSFTTIAPRTLAYPSINPTDGQTIGVGQPLALYFDAPIANKQQAQDSITVTTSPHVEGAFYWFSNKEVHWRPQQFWEPGTHVTVDIRIYGKNLGNGVYGQEDRVSRFTIGRAFIARADGATHQMTVEINGQPVRTMPISMGSPEFASANGIHVVTERNATKIMDSTTFGLALDAGGYMTKVQWATRISNGGEFVHSAPWSVG